MGNISIRKLTQMHFIIIKVFSEFRMGGREFFTRNRDGTSRYKDRKFIRSLRSACAKDFQNLQTVFAQWRIYINLEKCRRIILLWKFDMLFMIKARLPELGEVGTFRPHVSYRISARNLQH